MASKFTLFTTLLLAFTALANPSRLGEHPARRRVSHRSQPINRADAATSTNVTDYYTSYSNNWAGAELQGDAGMFTSISGTFTVPEVYGEAGAGVAFWVGIDGNGCSSGALLQVGVGASVGSDGQTVSYGAWFEWIPDASIALPSININPYDVVSVTVGAYSDMMSGYVVVEDQTNGEYIWQEVDSTAVLCGQTAEWIVEDYMGSSGGNDGMVPLANFGTVTFTGAVALGFNDQGLVIYPAFEAGFIDMAQGDGQILTNSYLGGDDSVNIEYTGP